jgi:Ca-activated chloride channel family protein
MFGFAQPEFLLLGLLVPPLVWYWLRLRRPALLYSNTSILTGLPRGRRRFATWASAVLRTAALSLVIVALAGPRWADAGSRLTTEGIAIEILVDVSGSMAEKDFQWNKKRISRLKAVKNVFRLFVQGGVAPGGERLEGRPNDLIGLVTFATRPKTVCPLTLSHDALLELLKAEKPRSIPEESRTNIGDAIAWGVDDLVRAKPRRKILILFTDGEHNVDAPALTPLQAAQLAASQDIPIYAIDAGGESAGPEGNKEDAVRSAEDRAKAVKSLQSISEKLTRGKYFRAQDTRALLDVCRDIDRLEKQPIESFHYRYYYEGHAWFALAALVLFVGVLVLEGTLWKRVL